MWSEGCICCSPDTVQQSSARDVLAGTPSRTEDIAYVHCQNCSCKVCSFCVMGLTQLVTESNKKIPQEGPSILALKSMALALKSMDEPKVDFGFCCSFKQSIPSSTKSTIVTPHRAPEISMTDKDLLRFLSYHEAILPRFAHGCMIIRAQDRYLFCYAKATPSTENKFVMWSYCPPKAGGAFDMPDSCIAMFPPVAEMIYLKAFSISVLVSLNRYFHDRGEPAVATGPLKFELVSLEHARILFNNSPPEKAMYRFLCLLQQLQPL